MGGDPKVESGSNVGNGTSIPIGGALSLGESSDAYDEPSSLSWRKAVEQTIRRWNQSESHGCL